MTADVTFKTATSLVEPENRLETLLAAAFVLGSACWGAYRLWPTAFPAEHYVWIWVSGTISIGAFALSESSLVVSVNEGSVFAERRQLLTGRRVREKLLDLFEIRSVRIRQRLDLTDEEPSLWYEVVVELGDGSEKVVYTGGSHRAEEVGEILRRSASPPLVP